MEAIDLKEIQDEDTSPSEIISKIPMEVEGFKPPQEEDILILRSERTRRAPNHLSINVEVEEHSLGDLNEPTSYKVAMLDSESNKWIDAMNAKIQSMMDNMVCVLVDFSGCRLWEKATFILRIKIYRYRSKRLIGLCQNAYMDKILKRYKTDTSKRDHIPMQERLDLNKTQGASTPKEVKRMQNVPYTSGVGSITYAVRCNKILVNSTGLLAVELEKLPVKVTTGKPAHITKLHSCLRSRDGSSALHFANEPGVQMGAKHYHRRFFKVHTDDNLADPFIEDQDGEEIGFIQVIVDIISLVGVVFKHSLLQYFLHIDSGQIPEASSSAICCSSSPMRRTRIGYAVLCCGCGGGGGRDVVMIAVTVVVDVGSGA
ncbi:hypothetical protein Tco_1154086 [Tanacetum coccineum]